jgi:multidrug efflux pump subunit AcrA (membrane-fusion protein)
MPRTARHLTTAAVLALTGLLAACSDTEELAEPPLPTPTPTVAEPSPSPSPTPSTEPGNEKPQRPAAMDQHNAEGAVAALHYFLSLDPYAMRTGDVAALKAMSHRSCGYCSSRLEQAETISERGDIYEGGFTTATVLKKYQRDPVTGIWPLDVELWEEAALITDRSGGEVFASPDGTAQRRVEMGVVDGEWVVVEIGLIPGK